MPRPPRAPRKPRTRTPPPQPTEAGLREAALVYLARFAATETGLRRVLERRIARWAASAPESAESAAALRQAARAIAHSLTASGAIDDAAFAGSRARSLLRAGKSARAIGAHLAAKGVPAALAPAPPDADQALAAAAIHARKRRLGPYRRGVADAALQRRELGNLARGGFPGDIARRCLALSFEEAEALILALRAAL